MRTDLISADYSQLERIGQQFQRTSEKIQRVHHAIEKPYNRLKNGGWEGKGADSFIEEMERTVFPAIVRLRLALANASRTVVRIGQTVYTAEEEASALFRDTGTSGSANSEGKEGGTGGFGSGNAKIHPTNSYVSLTIDMNYQDITAQTDPTVDPERQELMDALQQFFENSNNPEILFNLFPDLANVETLSNEKLEALLAQLTERQYLLDVLYASQSLYEQVAGADLLPDNLEQLSNEELHALLDSQDIHRQVMALNFGFWLLAADPELSGMLTAELSLLSPQEQIDFLYSLYTAMPMARDYVPGTEIDPATFPPIEFLSETTPSSEALDLFQRSITAMRDMMAQSVGNDEIRIKMLTASPFFGEEIGEGLGDSGADGMAAMAMTTLPPNIRNLMNLGLSAEELSNLWGAAVRIGMRGARGMQRLFQIMSALPVEQLRRLAQNFDIDFNISIYQRLAELRDFTRYTTDDLREMGYTLREINSRNRNFLTRTDIPVEELPGTPLMYGASRNLNPSAIAFEYRATGKPDPTLAIYAATNAGAAEFDWYRMNDGGHLVLLDAKFLQPYGLYDLTSNFGSTNRHWFRDEALRQSEAARLIGQNVTVEWVVPHTTSVAAVNALQNYLRNDLGITNINVVPYIP